MLSGSAANPWVVAPAGTPLWSPVAPTARPCWSGGAAPAWGGLGQMAMIVCAQLGCEEKTQGGGLGKSGGCVLWEEVTHSG